MGLRLLRRDLLWPFSLLPGIRPLQKDTLSPEHRRHHGQRPTPHRQGSRSSSGFLDGRTSRRDVRMPTSEDRAGKWSGKMQLQGLLIQETVCLTAAAAAVPPLLMSSQPAQSCRGTAGSRQESQAGLLNYEMRQGNDKSAQI